MQDFPKVSYSELKKKGINQEDIEEYYLWQEKLRRKIHPNENLSPRPEEYFHSGPDGVQIFIQEFIPENLKGIVICLHGNTIQSDLFYVLADELRELQIGVVAIDNRGHGRSGPEGHGLNHPERMFPVYNAIIQKYRDYPIAMHGESLGCTMLGAYLASHPPNVDKIKAIIFQVPPLKFHLPFNFHKLRIPILSLLRILRWMSFDTPFLPNRPEFIASYFHEFHRIDRIDPIRRIKTSAEHLYTTAQLLFQFPKTLTHISAPLLILEGTADTILDAQGSIEIMQQTHHIKRRIHIYKGADHSLFHDKNAQGIYSEIKKWLNRFLE